MPALFAKPLFVACGLVLLAGAPAAPVAAPHGDSPSLLPDSTARKKLFDDLFARLRDAPNASSADQIRAVIVHVWTHSGSPTADLLLARAEAAMKAEQNQAAARLLNRIVSLYPDWSEAWRRRAQQALVQGDSEGAMIDLDRALAAEPRDFLAMMELSEMMQTAGDDKPALELLRRALALDPQNAPLRVRVKRLERKVEGQDI
jgi:tetratricopeptide (TPR) repeat protein